MNHFQKGMFDKIQEKANLSPEEIFQVVDSVKHANFNDEQPVRDLIRRLSRLANRPVSKEKEDKIVEAVIKNKVSLDPNQMNKFLDN
mgnify:CR=1 FL=1